MDQYTATEQAFKHGYEKGYETGKPKWIPVSERLPAFDVERVLVMVNANLILGYPQMDTDRYLNNRWVRYGDHVTHWMPLPEPPKEGE